MTGFGRKVARWCLGGMLTALPVSAWSDEPAGTPPVLRVCADPNNLPFSNQAGEGFENRLAALLAKSLGMTLDYTWHAQRRGFLRETLNAGLCDVVMGLPSRDDKALTTRPYYRSSYVLVYPTARGYRIRSLDDPKLKRLRIGVHLAGDKSSPPALALARRGIIDNVVGYSVYGDYGKASPPLQLVDGVAQGDIDVAVAWGPAAGYFAGKTPAGLTLVPLADDRRNKLPFVFSISLGVRKSDKLLKSRLDAALDRNRDAIAALLDGYHVPRTDPRHKPASFNH
ncbi:substrate-binding domain-containing protein [Candidatus Methylomicrobium oryzae]|uniref:substrate-binding domain-containing protein n=1 Tax=Candidatus Methylomicrobium oryzae TaxID=2802053 RepID=UPI0030187154